ncbi:MAG: DUF4403 family protein [Flavobacteriales bacterium]
MKQLIFISFLSIILTSCGSIEPVAPEKVIQEVPTLTQKESTIYLPIKINLQPYFNDTEKSLPKTFNGKEDNCSGVSYSYKFTRNPIEFEGKGDYMYYEVDGKYSLNLNYCPECTYLFDSKGTCVVPRIYTSCGVGEPMRRVSVGYTTKFSITNDFRFKTETELRKFETIDPCEITVFSYDATGQLRKELTKVLKDLEKDIDKEISSIDLRSQIKDVWQILSEPTSLEKYGYLSIKPKAISLSDIKFDKKQAFIDLSLTIQPMVTTNPPEFKNTELPRLSEHKRSDGFDINLDIIASYDSLTSILTKELSGKRVEIKKNEIIFKTIGIEGASDKQLTIKVGFEGSKKGTLYLVGTPIFDSLKQVISFPDLSFDIQTKNALLKSAKWLFSEKITDMMRASAVFDLNPHLVEMKKSVQKEMNRELTEGVRLSGKIEGLEIINIFPNHHNLIIRAHSTGEMKLSM